MEKTWWKIKKTKDEEYVNIKWQLVTKNLYKLYTLVDLNAQKNVLMRIEKTFLKTLAV